MQKLNSWLCRPLTQALLVGLAFFLLYTILCSRHYMAVDGSTRCLEVYGIQGLRFHGNNHVLYPIDVIIWHKLLSVIGIKATSALEFLNLTQIMNSLAAGITIGIFYYLLRYATSLVGVSLGTTITYGWSRAFLLHATNSSEPMVAVLWSILAILVAVIALRSSRSYLLIGCGFFLALAMATYQSMVLVGPICLFLCWRWPRTAGVKRDQGIVRSAYMLGSSGFSTLLIYGTAYYLSGTTSPLAMLKRFFIIEGQQIYGSFASWKVVFLISSYIRNVVPIFPLDFCGISYWVTQRWGNFSILWYSIIFYLLAIPVVLLVIPLLRLWATKQLPDQDKMGILAAIVGTIATIIPTLYWMADYDKLWIQPIGCVTFLLGLSLAIIVRERPWRLHLPLTILTSLVLAIVVGSNAFWAVPSHYQENIALKAAAEVSQTIKSEDLVINYWDDISLLYGALWSKHICNFPGLAEVKGGKTAIAELPTWIADTHKRGGEVYFLCILDESESDWEKLLGIRGVPYHTFDLYRQKSHEVLRFKYNGVERSLRVLDKDYLKDQSLSSVK